MRILFVTPMLCYPGVPYAGEATIYRLMESLTQRGHEVFLITGLRPGDEKHISEVSGACTLLETIHVPWSKRDVYSDIVIWAKGGCRGGLTFRKKAAVAVRNHSEKTGFDIIQVEHTDLGAFMERPADRTPIIISAVDVLFKPLLRQYHYSWGWKKAVNYFRYIRTKKSELSLYRRFDSVFTWSQYDKSLLKAENPGLKIFVTRPFVNIDADTQPSGKREPSAILFSGAMNRSANIKACLFLYEQVFSRVRKDIEGVKLYIVGNAPPESIQEIGARDTNVIVTGYVESMEPFFSTATVFVSPIFFGGGIIVKNLEAMGRGLPVVTTTIGNEGGGATPDKDILTADDAETFSGKIIRLIKDRQYREDIARNGNLFVTRNFSWQQTVERVENEYMDIVSNSL